MLITRRDAAARANTERRTDLAAILTIVRGRRLHHRARFPLRMYSENIRARPSQQKEYVNDRDESSEPHRYIKSRIFLAGCHWLLGPVFLVETDMNRSFKRKSPARSPLHTGLFRDGRGSPTTKLRILLAEALLPFSIRSQTPDSSLS